MRGMVKLSSLVLLLLILGGCSNTTPETTTEAPVTTEAETTAAPATEPETEAVTEAEPEPILPTFGGTLRVGMSPAETLDPLENKIANVDEVLGLVYESLFTLDNALMPVPVLVDSYDYILDGRGLTLTLKEGVTFHNEMPLTPEDVAYTIDLLKDSEASPYRPLIVPIKRVSVGEEGMTVTLYYDEPYAFMLNDLTFPIVSAGYRGSEAYDPMVPVGTGPYTFGEYQDMQHLILKANMNWHMGDVLVETVQAVAMNESDNMESLFDQHLIDLMNPPKFNWLKYSENEDQQIQSYNSTNYDFLGFNMNKELFQDKDLRKAFAYAIDREEILYNQFINHAIAVDTPVVPGSWFASDRGLTYEYSPDLALTHLNGQVYKDQDGDGFFDQKDVLDDSVYKPLELIMLVNEASSVRTAVAPKIEAYIEAIGFQVSVEVVDSTSYYERIQNGDFDLLYGGWQLSTKPDYVALFASDGSQNYFGYNSPEMDLTLKSLVSAYDMETVQQRTADFEDLLLEDMPYVSLYFLEGAVMSHGNVYGDLMPTSAGTFNSIQSIYLDLTED